MTLIVVLVIVFVFLAATGYLSNHDGTRLDR
jgi:hypothetical protein